MSTEPVNRSEPTYTEAPASWTSTYVTQDGFVCRLTLRGESGKDLLDKAAVALSFLLERGYLPDHSNGNHNGKSDTKQCPIHQVEMRLYQKDGRSWYSHRTDDGGWCRGKEK